MLELVTPCLVLILSALVVIFWYRRLLEATPRSLVRVLAFPGWHWRQLLGLRDHPAAFPIFFCYLYVLDSLFALCVNPTAYLTLAEWSFILIAESFLVCLYLFDLRKGGARVFCLAIIAFYAGVGSVLTLKQRNYQIYNAFDFGECAFLLLAGSWIIGQLIRRDRFEQDLVALFTFFGLTLYAALQLLATIIMSFDFIQNADFSTYAVMVTFLFWLAAVPWIRHLQSKLTSPYPSSSSSPSPG